MNIFTCLLCKKNKIIEDDGYSALYRPKFCNNCGLKNYIELLLTKGKKYGLSNNLYKKSGFINLN